MINRRPGSPAMINSSGRRPDDDFAVTPARTLTEALRALDQDQLTELFRLRPDLGYPLPRHIGELVSQATTSVSIGRAIEALNAWQLAIAGGLAVLADGATIDDLRGLVGRPRPAISGAIEDLRRRALLWGTDADLHLVRAARDHFGSYPAGLAPPSPHPLTDRQIDTALAAAGDQVRPVLDRLLWGPPTGTVRNADRTIRVADARTPVELLLAHRLLRPLDRDTVIMPQEVALRLRSATSDYLLGPEPVSPAAPMITGRAASRTVIRSASAGAANEIVHDAELIISDLDAHPRRLLRDSGISTRDVQAISRALDGRVDYTGFLLEAASAAGLIGSPDRITVLPTTEFDRWVTLPGPDRWLRLATAWRDADRYFSSTVESHPLSAEAVAPRAPDNRRLIMNAAASAGVGTVINVDDLAEVTAWHRPSAGRHAQQLAVVIGWTWQEATWLGLTALGAVTDLLPAVLDDRPVPDDLAGLFPEPLDRVIIQSDLTAIAQGPLEAAVASTLRLLADQESRGGGAVYRFSPGSVRRGFDSGWAAAEISDWLIRHSATGIPQPLRYLIDDVARQHGTVRVGGAASYLRIEDPAQQAAILAHPEAARLQLRSIAPGVLVSGADPEEVVQALRGLGLKPAAEDDQGRLLTTRPPRRAGSRRPDPPERRQAAAEEIAAAVLAADRRLPRPPAGAGASVDDGLESLRRAAERAEVVRLGLVDGNGRPSTRELRVQRVGDGAVHGVDPGTGETVSVPIARISGVLLGDPPN
ncbi:helicase-associated domain-containing protein [Microlunatus endophyticus]|uniref:helicase-associated domain-containing protein n=1 Tax=Microlunatus endophyticus TaxID=1716077 RepID=UPI00166813B9|nr:helicase-associated domain-containing protein [Microlunatus endophyticus]